MCKISLSFRFRISLSDMTNYKSAFGKVCRIKNRQTFKSLPICNSSYHDLVWYAELKISILLKVCRFVIRHITQTDTETETELLRRHPPPIYTFGYGCSSCKGVDYVTSTMTSQYGCFTSFSGRYVAKSWTLDLDKNNC